MAVFTVDSDAILTQSAAVRATVDRLHAESQAMLAQLTQLQSSWTGQAAGSFQQVIDQWRATQRQVEDSLAAITQSLAAAGRQYADTELAALSLFR
ncbi:MAG: WXG100 family type VII secretion target [Microbacterium sp.]|jgi:early secretory antigenic target protein ESAT-6|uniref:WXG100 family type VII secretion target n=1 Tax=unclassified Microbacterium TaxID=2609290 RepID=UPI000DB5ADFE|nr:WXG100 family type VII secretion target [Microbacterium sp.]PZU36361.1 MAG: WXG100 family type VII secretion target [Microbacterium sp.]